MNEKNRKNTYRLKQLIHKKIEKERLNQERLTNEIRFQKEILFDALLPSSVRKRSYSEMLSLIRERIISNRILDNIEDISNIVICLDPEDKN